jgi:acyl carrier protein
MILTETDIKTRLKDFLAKNFLLGKDPGNLKDSDSFLDTGIVDSTGVLEFVAFLQETWSIEVADEELLPENFDSIANLTAFVLKKAAG